MTHSFKGLVAVLAATTVLGGCDDLFNSSSSSEETGTVDQGIAAFDEQVIETLDLNFNAAQMTVTPADQMPTSGLATYQGVVGFSDTATTGNVAEYDMLSDLTLQTDFSSGAVTGQMSNFNTRDDTAMNGSLTLTEGQISGSGFTANAIGTFTEADTAESWDLDIDADFRGAGGSMILGTANGTVTNGGTETSQIFGDLVATQ